MDFLDIDPAKVSKITKKLNELLSNYQIHTHKLKAFHWNIKGKYFFELHAKFEELYNDAIPKVDEIAERILILGHTPVSTLKQYMDVSTIKEIQKFDSKHKMVEEVVSDLNWLLVLEKSCLELAVQAKDQGTVEMLSRFISFQEKTSWKFLTWLHD